jgi:hypothetical protein
MTNPCTTLHIRGKNACLSMGKERRVDDFMRLMGLTTVRITNPQAMAIELNFVAEALRDKANNTHPILRREVHWSARRIKVSARFGGEFSKRKIILARLDGGLLVPKTDDDPKEALLSAAREIDAHIVYTGDGMQATADAVERYSVHVISTQIAAAIRRVLEPILYS